MLESDEMIKRSWINYAPAWHQKLYLHSIKNLSLSFLMGIELVLLLYCRLVCSSSKDGYA